MKVTLKLTLDGLMRALTAHAHRLAEEIEAGRIAERRGDGGIRPKRQTAEGADHGGDD